MSRRCRGSRNIAKFRAVHGQWRRVGAKEEVGTGEGFPLPLGVGSRGGAVHLSQKIFQFFE